jgi:hypothetical protein
MKNVAAEDTTYLAKTLDSRLISFHSFHELVIWWYGRSNRLIPFPKWLSKRIPGRASPNSFVSPKSFPSQMPEVLGFYTKDTCSVRFTHFLDQFRTIASEAITSFVFSSSQKSTYFFQTKQKPYLPSSILCSQLYKRR